MDTIKKYQKIVRDFLHKEAKTPLANRPMVGFKVIVDEQQSDFLLLMLGWHEQQYYYGISIHIEVKEEEVIVLQNNTDTDLQEEFVQLGINHDNIKLFSENPDDTNAVLAA